MISNQWFVKQRFVTWHPCESTCVTGNRFSYYFRWTPPGSQHPLDLSVHFADAIHTLFSWPRWVRVSQLTVTSGNDMRRTERLGEFPISASMWAHMWAHRRHSALRTHLYAPANSHELYINVSHHIPSDRVSTLQPIFRLNLSCIIRCLCT